VIAGWKPLVRGSAAVGYAWPRIQSDKCSPIMMQVRLMFARRSVFINAV
jgi:hypothetical protein